MSAIGNQQVGQQLAFRGDAEDVQAIPDLHFLQLAQIIVELGDGLGLGLAAADAAVLIQARLLAELHDVVLEDLEAAGIEVLGFVIFIDQLLEIAERPVAFGPRQRRRQMIDDHGAHAPLGLGAFSGVVDDEWIDVGQRPQGRFGKAFGRQRHRLARQPFQVSVLAHMDHGVGVKTPPEPGVKGEIVVRRHQVRVVVAGLGIDVVPARRLQADGCVPETERGDGKVSAIGPAGDEERVFFGAAPALVNGFSHRFRQGRQEQLIIGHG